MSFYEASIYTPPASRQGIHRGWLEERRREREMADTEREGNGRYAGKRGTGIRREKNKDGKRFREE